MDVKKLDSMPGMPGGFAFAMVLLGIALAVLGAIFGSIEGRFFQSVNQGFQTLGLQLIEWGAVLQGVIWVVAGFSRKTSPPAA